MVSEVFPSDTAFWWAVVSIDDSVHVTKEMVSIEETLSK